MKKNKKIIKKSKKDEDEEEEDEHSGGASLDDAFADDADVEYAPSKPKKEKKKKKGEEDLDEELDEAEEEVEKISNVLNGANDEPPKIKASKPVIKVKKGDRIKIDGKDFEVDSHYVLIDHGTTKEMAIELFDKDDRDYQLRYFDDQMEATMQFYELQEILYVKKPVKNIEW